VARCHQPLFLLREFRQLGDVGRDLPRLIFAEKLARGWFSLHTIIPTPTGATVYVADLDGSALDAIKNGAARYDAEVTIQVGRAEFIGDTEGTGSDREQRDRARQIS
jgi:hypothetical protein